MTESWNFANYNYGRRQGISDSGVETFKKDRYGHLAKEICQNSLDALKKGEKLVEIEFQSFDLNREDIPGYKRFMEVFNQCFESSSFESGKTQEFFKYSNKLLQKGNVKVLRISDFNTTGLIGSKEEKDTPWNDLIKAAGISNKGGDAGGSFGIGKYAVFACSNLRTVFYSTYDEDSVEASQGVAEVINFIDVDGKEKEGEGYYGIGSKNLPIFNQLNLDPNFSRGKRTGTDIYILGFIDRDDWEESIIYSVIDSFLIAIYNEKLEVKVGNTLINKDTLKDIIENKLDYDKFQRNRNSLEFYKVLTSDETIVKSFDLSTDEGNYLGEFKVYILIDNELISRRILMSRINGMKVFEQDRFPRGIPFSGICILQDKIINDYFRKMETPEHNAWKADQFSENPKEIKEADATRLKMIREIRDELNNLAKKTTLDETDVGELGMLLPDIEDDLLGSKGKNESLISEDKNSQITIKLESENNEKIMPVYSEENGKGDFDPKGPGKGGGKSYYNNNRKGMSKHRVPNSFFIIRMFQIGDAEYRMVIQSQCDLKDSELLVSAVGEDNGTRLNIGILQAINRNSNKKMEIQNKRIILGDIEKNSRTIIDFKPDLIEQLSMEVVIYEN
ncbi:hypothetical protein [Peptoniphilus duerdenii]|uniref:hypothetical protein n=1 Tax=Peptoniphilus duerdenii TaxID=507750 RepID=UPI0023F1607C|nr:hypothetical protein [Peptoniphilus duerdenii]